MKRKQCRMPLMILVMSFSAAVNAHQFPNTAGIKHAEAPAQKASFVLGHVLIQVIDGIQITNVLREHNIAFTSANRVLSPAQLIAGQRQKLERTLRKAPDGWYWYMGLQYEEVSQVPDKELLARAYQDLSTTEQKLFRWYTVTLPDTETDIEALVEALSNDPRIEAVQPDYEYEYSLEVNDTYYNSSDSWGQQYDDLWGLKRIKAEEAWTITEGAGAVVAVIDSGIDYNHPDIFANIWVNEREVSDRNRDGVIDIHDIDTNRDGTISAAERAAASDGIDQDANGCPDDLFGWDFGESRDENEDGDFLDSGDIRDNDPMDEIGHGTHVAGIIAAVRNGIGIVGVAPEAKVVAVKLEPRMYTSVIAQGWYYSAKAGADVINNSWGPELPDWSNPFLENIIDYLVDELECVVVFAAGNVNNDMRQYAPNNYPKVITVASTTTVDGASNFSNWGGTIDVAAPGGNDKSVSNWGDEEFDEEKDVLNVNILSLRAAGTDMCCNPDEDPKELCGQMILDEAYYRARGTSMSAAYVSGLVALLVSEYPDDSAYDTYYRIRKGAEDILLEGFDWLSGWGVIDCKESLEVVAMPVVTVKDISVIEHQGNGDKLVEPGETARVEVNIHNEWKPLVRGTLGLSSSHPSIDVQTGDVALLDLLPDTDSGVVSFTVAIRKDYLLSALA